MSYEDEDENKDSGYLKISDDFDQLRHGYDGMEKAKGGAKLLGKGLFNVGKYALTEFLPKVIEQVEKNRNK
jgi:hypothetical protein